MSVSAIKLSNNALIPQVGFGTWMIKDETECISSVKTALGVGYRHFDTAQIYANEQFVGQALAESNIPRDDLFITTKVWKDNMFWDDVFPSVEESLKNLQTGYVDLLLLHFPVTELRRPAWRRMEDLVDEGKALSIGVSNYTVTHLEELLAECSIRPVVNQVELHMFLQQPELVQYCRDNQIALEAYSPLSHGIVLENEDLNDIARNHNKTAAQVMIRWCLDQDFIPLPKSVGHGRIQENFDVFDFSLTEEELQQITKLDSNFRTCWDPTHVT